MSITKYEVFLKSVELGSFTRAGEELNITQSGVSHTVAALEKELGVGIAVSPLAQLAGAYGAAVYGWNKWKE